jgi:hypothetical protein
MREIVGGVVDVNTLFVVPVILVIPFKFTDDWFYVCVFIFISQKTHLELMRNILNHQQTRDYLVKNVLYPFFAELRGEYCCSVANTTFSA